ncbi:hypothetical protein K449DRAFT_131949 [Hypoxylon sp. EC38]|nr:hypothetical protein K449DRAFT_131949 [Hypoxylon sp. EC38]
MSGETSPNRNKSSNPVSENISQAASKCKDALKSCLDIELLMYEEWAENRLADFNLWAAGSGVFASQKASLDHRLSGQPSLLSLVATSLTLLNDYIEECKVVGMANSFILIYYIPDLSRAHSSYHPTSTDTHNVLASDECSTRWTDGTALSSYNQVQDGQQNNIDPADIPRPFTPWSDQSSSSEIDELSSGANTMYPALSSAKEKIEQILDNLLRLIVAIRKAGSGSRFRRADELYRPSDYLARRRYLELIIQTRLSLRGEKSPQVGYHNITTAQVRLIEANLRRRNRFLYFQTHSEKLSLDRTISGQASNKRPGAKPDATKLPTLAPSSRDPVAPTDPAVTPDPTPLLTDTNASELITKSGVSPTAVPTPSHIAPSQVTSVVAGKVVYPQPPPLPTGHQSFKCPCCCQSLPTIFRDKKIWKKHLMDDIEPYTCYIEECPEPDKLYRHQAQWMEHLRDDHPQCWYCLPCSTPLTKPLLFPTIQELICHTKDAHAEAISDDQLPILVSSSRRPKPFGISRCPLCYTTGEADSDYLLTHIAEHIHQFSLQSLPWPDDPSSEDYFCRNPYFGDIFDSSSASNGSPQSDRDSDDLPSLLSLEYNKTNDPSSDESGTMGGQSHDLTQLSLKRLAPGHIKDSNQLDRYLEGFPYPAYDEVDSSEEHGSVDYSADTAQIRSKNEAPRTTDSGTNISLEKELRDAIIYPKGQDGGFIPIDRFDEILTRQRVWRELRSCLPKASIEDLDGWVDKIWEKSECFDPNTGRKTVSTRRKIFAISVLVKVPEKIQSFINEELWDKDLPFILNFERKWECYLHGHQNEARIVECLNNLNDWSTFEADSFYNYQWFMLSPIFNMADENVIFYSLHGRIILPFEKGNEPVEEYSLVE